MSILVAGGGGFIGSHLVKKLVETGEKVVVFDSQPIPHSLQNLGGQVVGVKGDATQMADILHAIQDHEVRDIYHLIALLADVCQQKPLLALKVNVETTLNFLEAARLCNLGKVIFASSVAVYHPLERPPVGEDASTNPPSVYGATKVASEFFGLHYQRNFGIDFRALRFTTIYGRGKSGGSTGICSLMIEKSALGESIRGDIRDAVTDWLYIKDAINSLILVRTAESPRERIFNIGGGSYRVGEVAEVVKRLIPSAQIELEAKRLFPWPPAYDWKRAERELGYKPQFNLESGVKDFIEEVRKS